MKTKYILSIALTSVLAINQLVGQITYTGKITDSRTLAPLMGANVGIAGTYYQAQSKVDGGFELKNIPNGKQNLKISYIGYRDTVVLLSPENKTLIVKLSPSTFWAQEVVVNATRASKNSAGTFNEIGKEELAKMNLGQDMPLLLNQMPSVVVNSDAGAGVGYSGISIRGSDATRVNLTINGIPINDAESHSVFWVNMPDLVSSVENIQVQRGVGTSTNGAGAFGASINIQTQSLSEKAYAEVNNSYGSFNTHKHTLKFGSGLLGKHFIFDGRLSLIGSDGYIQRAASDLKSFYVSGGYFGKSTTLKFNVFSGKEKTYQAWNGVPQDLLATNRTFNSFTYPNQTDNYQQDNYQLLLSQTINSKLDFNFALHYTRGRGYFEEFKEGDDFNTYGLAYPIVGSDTIFTQNLVRQKWLNNHFYGFTFSLNYKPTQKWDILVGGAANRYIGGHYGLITWSQYALSSEKDYRYYNDTAFKTDINAYAKSSLRLGSQITLFADLQLRYICYAFQGFNENLQVNAQDVNYLFFNPKVGITFDITEKNYIQASYSVGNREPTRNDFVESTPSSRPTAETMHDIELGFKHSSTKWNMGITMYGMYYLNQLVPTGKVNDVGYYTRQNVDKSYRAGIELQAAVKLLKPLTLQGNLTLSQNKIINFVEYIDDYDNGGQVVNNYQTSNIALAPSIISAGSLVYSPIQTAKHSMAFTLSEKYVGRQFLDNTSQVSRSLNPFFVNDFRVNYTWRNTLLKELNITLSINNIFGIKYEPNGYTYSYIYGGMQTFNFYFPQAGCNYMVGVGLKF